MKKFLKVILCIALILLDYTPLMGSYMRVEAAGEYVLAVAYPDDDVVIESNLSYSEAYTKMMEYPSTETAVAVIKKDGKYVNARWATVNIDIDSDTGSRRRKDEENHVVETSYTADGAYGSAPGIADYYGAEAALLDVDVSRGKVKFKISGEELWTTILYTMIVPISKYYTTYNTNWYGGVAPKIYAKTNDVKVYKEAKTDSEELGTLKKGSKTSNLYKYYPSKSTTKTDTCTWYYLDFNSDKGYVCSTNIEEVTYMYTDT